MEWVVKVTLRPLHPRERRGRVVREAESVPVPFWIAAENFALTGFDPRTAQPLASLYTDWAVPARL